MAARRHPALLLFAASCLAPVGRPSGAAAAAAAAAAPAPPPQPAEVAGLVQKFSLWPFGEGEEHYDCADNDKASIVGWSEAKLRYCCQRQGGGAAGAAPCPRGEHGGGDGSFDCDGGEVETWSRAKREYCCAHEHRGCRAEEVDPRFETVKHGHREADRSSEHHFDCVAGFAHWRQVWSKAKRKECCARFERGCEEAITTSAGPSTTTQPFDCQADFKNWMSGWSVKKKQWCCQTAGRGCNHVKLPLQGTDKPSGDSENDAHMVSSKASYDCLSDAWNWVTGWSKKKKDWCCTKHGLGCDNAAAFADDRPAQAPAPSAPPSFNCENEYNSWESSWSHLKKNWCCKTKGLGCAVEGSPNADTHHFECEGPQDNWTDSQKKFCCSEAGVGCTEAADETDTSHTEAPATTETTTSPEKSKPDPKPTAVARTTSLPYDCDHTYVTWKSSWSNGKKAWCCLRDGRGCPSDYDCDAGYSEWQKEWTGDQKKWCCKHLHRGCASEQHGQDQAAHAAEGDAKEEHAKRKDRGQDATSKKGEEGPKKEEEEKENAQSPRREEPKQQAMAADKKEEEEGGDRGGEVASTTSAAPSTQRRSSSSSSSSSTAAAREGASAPKDTTTTFAPYDCEAAFGSWKKTWSTPKKHWCCKHRGKGCEEEDGDRDLHRYDCDKGFDDWINAWGKAKRAWCCMNKPALAGHAMCFVAEGKFQSEANGEPPATAAASSQLGEVISGLAFLGGLSLAVFFLVASRVRRYASRTVAYGNVGEQPILVAEECME